MLLPYLGSGTFEKKLGYDFVSSIKECLRQSDNLKWLTIWPRQDIFDLLIAARGGMGEGRGLSLVDIFLLFIDQFIRQALFFFTFVS